MAPTQSRSQRKAAFLLAAGEMYERLETWYDGHPTATFEEIEAEVRPQRRELLGGLLATLIVGRDSGFQASAPPCRKCQQPMTFEGYRSWTVKGLEGDSVLERAYYVCPACAGETFSPSGSETGLTGRSLEWWSGTRGDAAGVAGQVVRSGGDGVQRCGGVPHFGR
jgi:hypothetical protein